MATSLELMVLATRMKSWRSHLIFSLEESIRQTERSYIISYASYAYMADHSVVIRDKLYESEASWVSVFCFDNASPEKSCFVDDLICVISLCLQVFEVVYLRPHFTQTELHETSITVESPSE